MAEVIVLMALHVVVTLTCSFVKYFYYFSKAHVLLAVGLVIAVDAMAVNVIVLMLVFLVGMLIPFFVYLVLKMQTGHHAVYVHLWLTKLCLDVPIEIY